MRFDREKLLQQTIYLSGLIAGASACGTALAQSAAAQSTAGAETQQLEEVTVTGSRLQVAGFNAPTPVTVIGAETIEQRAPANVSDVLLEQPAFRISGTDTARSETGTNAPNPRPQTIQATPDLRSLGPQRTLVLINGHRSVGTNWDQVVDINIVPVGLIERVDVVTGGASAAYGSDAVAGVTNVILRNRMEGIKFGGQFGETGYSSAKQYTLNLSGGTALLDNRLHIIGGVDANRIEGIQNVYGKSWAQAEYGSFAPLAAQRGAQGLQATVLTSGVEPASVAPGGLAVASSGQAYTFDVNGNPVAFQRGALNSNGQLMTGSTANYGYNLNNLAWLRLPSSRYDFMGRASFDVTDNFSTYIEVGNSRSTIFPFKSGDFMQGTGVGANNPAIAIAANNPFRTAAINGALGTGAFTLGRDDTELSFAGISGIASRADNETRRVVVGFEGSFATKWKWDAYYQNGRTFSSLERNDLSPLALQKAVNGCNTTTGFTANQLLLVNRYESLSGKSCVAFNPFGVGRNSQAAIDYIQNSSNLNTHVWQDAAAANVSGSPFSLPAGDLAVAGGLEWRQDKMSAISDAVSRAGNAFEGGLLTNSLVASPLGENSVREGFVEIGAPVVKNVAFAKSIDLNAAARVTKYELSGTVRTWKIGATWDPFDFLRLRLTKSHDIRAPGLRQLFFLNGPNSGNVDNTRIVAGTVGANGSTFALPTVASGLTRSSTAVGVLAGAPGNPFLRPEVANTVTGGAVFTHGGFQASVDYYYIDMRDTITAQGSQTVIDNCVAGDKIACSYINFDPTYAGGIKLIAAPNVNLNRTVVKGLDLEAGYRGRLGPGNFQVRGLVNYQPHNEAINFVTGQTTDSGNTLGSQPKLGYNLSFGYDVGRWQTNLQIRGFGQRRGNNIVYNADGSIAATTVLGPEDGAAYAARVASATAVSAGGVVVAAAGTVGASTSTISKNRWAGEYFVNPGVTYKVNDKVSAFLNVDNLLDKQPPELAGALAATTAVYDYLGRRFRVGFRANF